MIKQNSGALTIASNGKQKIYWLYNYINYINFLSFIIIAELPISVQQIIPGSEAEGIFFSHYLLNIFLKFKIAFCLFCQKVKDERHII